MRKIRETLGNVMLRLKAERALRGSVFYLICEFLNFITYILLKIFIKYITKNPT